MCVTEASQPASKQSKQMQANAKQASKQSILASKDSSIFT
jgi:hypothetical protein